MEQRYVYSKVIWVSVNNMFISMERPQTIIVY